MITIRKKKKRKLLRTYLIVYSSIAEKDPKTGGAGEGGDVSSVVVVVILMICILHQFLGFDVPSLFGFGGDLYAVGVADHGCHGHPLFWVDFFGRRIVQDYGFLGKGGAGGQPPRPHLRHPLDEERPEPRPKPGSVRP